MSGNGMKFQGTPREAATHMPWPQPAWPCNTGAWWGYQLGTWSPFFMDMWWLKNNGIVDAPVAVITGERDSGKSTMMKVWGAREHDLQGRILVGKDPDYPDGFPDPDRRRIHWDSRRNEQGAPEYWPIIDSRGGRIIPLARGAKINVYDQSLSEIEIVQRAINICEMVEGTETLPPDMVEAIQIAAHKMSTRFRNIQSAEVFEGLLPHLTAGDVEEYDESISQARLEALSNELENDPELKARLLANTGNGGRPDNSVEARAKFQVRLNKIMDAAKKVAQIHGRTLRADYGEILGSAGSMSDIFAQDHAVGWDWTGLDMLPNAKSLIAATRWRHYAKAAKADDHKAIAHILFSDEEHKAMDNNIHVVAKSASLRTIRETSSAVVDSTQFLTDYLMHGAPGSNTRLLAEGIVHSFAIYIFGKQTIDEANRKLLKSIGCRDSDINMLPLLTAGQFGVYLPNRRTQGMYFVQFVLTPSDIPLVATNHGAESMGESVHPLLVPGVAERARALGIYNEAWSQ